MGEKRGGKQGENKVKRGEKRGEIKKLTGLGFFPD